MTGTRATRAARGYLTRQAGSFSLVVGLTFLIAGGHAPASAQPDARLGTSKAVYAPNESVVVEFAGFPGKEQDWITVVKADAPTNTYAQWFYTKGKRDGSLTFDGLPAGDYEARGYFDWPSGGYSVRSRVSFRITERTDPLPPGGVNTRGGMLRSSRPVFSPNETVKIEFAGFPGNQQDWITVVPVSTPTDRYGQWQYTAGKKDGLLSFDGLPVGEYEARGYFNWPEGGYTVHARCAFRVGATPTKFTVRTRKSSYDAKERVVVEFTGFPGNQQDWITVVPASTPPDRYAQWEYTAGKRDGDLSFAGLAPGDYEARAYFNWPDGGYTVQARYAFTVR